MSHGMSVMLALIVPFTLFEETTSSRYTGRNAFGVTANIDRLTGRSYSVEFLNLNQFVGKSNRLQADDFREDWFVEVPMDPARPHACRGWPAQRT